MVRVGQDWGRGSIVRWLGGAVQLLCARVCVMCYAVPCWMVVSAVCLFCACVMLRLVVFALYFCGCIFVVVLMSDWSAYLF